jgi:hypothetical protein
MRLLTALLGFCAFAKAFAELSKDGWHSRGGWEALAVYCGCAAFASFYKSMRAAEDRKRAQAWRAYEVAIVRDGILAARHGLELK